MSFVEMIQLIWFDFYRPRILLENGQALEIKLIIYLKEIKNIDMGLSDSLNKKKMCLFTSRTFIFKYAETLNWLWSTEICFEHIFPTT